MKIDNLLSNPIFNILFSGGVMGAASLAIPSAQRKYAIYSTIFLGIIWTLWSLKYGNKRKPNPSDESQEGMINEMARVAFFSTLGIISSSYIVLQL
jgi:hypothetical protein